jgi:hypothetical protein
LQSKILDKLCAIAFNNLNNNPIMLLRAQFNSEKSYSRDQDVSNPVDIIMKLGRAYPLKLSLGWIPISRQTLLSGLSGMVAAGSL